MKIQLWRNATVKLTINYINFLIDPMLGDKGSFGEFPWTEDGLKNPLVNLPFTREELIKELDEIDVVLITHLHPDHLDEAAVQFLAKSTPIICSQKIAPAIKSFEFNNVIVINENIDYKNIKIHLTAGMHGKEVIGEKMGEVNGFFLEYKNQSVYVAGDTIWCEEVKRVIDEYDPKHIIVAGGAATFVFGEPVTMTFRDIKNVAAHAVSSKIWVTHLESVSPCREDRNFINESINSHALSNQCFVLEDGEKVDLTQGAK